MLDARWSFLALNLTAYDHTTHGTCPRLPSLPAGSWRGASLRACGLRLQLSRGRVVLRRTPGNLSPPFPYHGMLCLGCSTRSRATPIRTTHYTRSRLQHKMAAVQDIFRKVYPADEEVAITARRGHGMKPELAWAATQPKSKDKQCGTGSPPPQRAWSRFTLSSGDSVGTQTRLSVHRTRLLHRSAPKPVCSIST